MASADNIIKSEIANILGINVSQAWEIKDSDPNNNLYLVHYTQQANMDEYGELRGIVVDTAAKTVVCRSFGHTPTAVLDELKIDPDNNLHIIDLLGTEHVFDSLNLKIKIGFEGTIIRVFKHNDIVYHSTHRRLHISKSQWGNSIPFEQMYHQLNGPSNEMLFNPESKYSPYCHIFLLVHPDVLNVTKDNVGPGYIVYLGPKQMWNPDPILGPYKQTTKNNEPIGDNWESDPRPNIGWLDNTLKIPNTVSQLPSNYSDTNVPLTLSPFNLSLQQANKHLRYGFYDSFDDQNLDPRLRTGEFVILYKLDANGQIIGLLRVQSLSYQWRTEMRHNDPNLSHRFYQLLNGSYIPINSIEGLNEYQRRYPILTRYSVDKIKHIIDSSPITVWMQRYPVSNWIKTKTDALQNIWMAFLMSVPLHKQKEVSQMYDSLIKDRSQLIEWLQTLNSQYDGNLSDVDIPDRAKRIIELSTEFAKQRLTEPHKQLTPSHQSNDNKIPTLYQLTQNNIRNLIMKEEGSSLYRLVKAMKHDKLEQM